MRLARLIDEFTGAGELLFDGRHRWPTSMRSPAHMPTRAVATGSAT
jgi:hypothetical protein